jgi:tRNA(fMet)-specific endonuclease VapC
MYLLDTNICIYAIKNRPEGILKRIFEKSSDGIFLSSLTVAELEYGVESSRDIEQNRIALMKFLSLFNVLSFDDSDAIPYGKVKASLKREGILIGPIDLLLAAQAISRGLVFVTNNTREFARVPDIRLENWAL